MSPGADDDDQTEAPEGGHLHRQHTRGARRRRGNLFDIPETFPRRPDLEKDSPSSPRKRFPRHHPSATGKPFAPSPRRGNVSSAPADSPPWKRFALGAEKISTVARPPNVSTSLRKPKRFSRRPCCQTFPRRFDTATGKPFPWARRGNLLKRFPRRCVAATGKRFQRRRRGNPFQRTERFYDIAVLNDFLAKFNLK